MSFVHTLWAYITTDPQQEKVLYLVYLLDFSCLEIASCTFFGCSFLRTTTADRSATKRGMGADRRRTAEDFPAAAVGLDAGVIFRRRDFGVDFSNEHYTNAHARQAPSIRNKVVHNM